jgi:Clathrin light chain
LLFAFHGKLIEFSFHSPFRNAEKENIAETDDIEPGTEWERIAKLCDFSQSTKGNKSLKDNGRMRSIILQLKQTPIEREKA